MKLGLKDVLAPVRSDSRNAHIIINEMPKTFLPMSHLKNR